MKFFFTGWWTGYSGNIHKSHLSAFIQKVEEEYCMYWCFMFWGILGKTKACQETSPPPFSLP